jgi:Ca2+-binding EF-hand superfamily protein
MRKSKIRSSRIRSVGDEIDFGEVEINNLIRDFMIREAFNMFDEDHSGDID